MRFFFKIFFTTLFIAVACTAAAGYVLIRDNVDTLLSSDTARAVESGSIAAYALSAADPGNADQVAQTAADMDVTYGGETLRFLLLDETGESVYSSLGEAYGQKLAALRDPEHLTWQLSEVGGMVHVLALRPTLLADSLYYVGTAQSVAHVFETQLRQYRLLLKILAGTVVAGGAVTLLLSKLLTRKLKAVVQASREIADGDLQCRAMVRGRDEFGSLARQFNRMADTLAEKIEALEEENERRTLFTGAFAHELRTPLTSIIGYADLLRRRASDERTILCTEYIFSEGQRLEKLSMRLLELIVLQQRKLQTETVAAEDFFQQVSVAAGGSGSMPEMDVEPTLLRMEPSLMHTVFLNLLDNARKASPPESPVTLTGRRMGENYVVTVQDRGHGMDLVELQKIRRPFYRIDPSRSRAQGGAGLGLAICDEILSLHGFSLEFESQPGCGTTATVFMKGAVEA